REHVHYARDLEHEAILVDEDAGVSGEAAGMARDVQHRVRTAALDQRQDLARSGARRIEQDLFIGLLRPAALQASRIHEIRRTKLAVRQIVARRITAGACNEARITSRGSDVSAALR